MEQIDKSTAEAAPIVGPDNTSGEEAQVIKQGEFPDQHKGVKIAITSHELRNCNSGNGVDSGHLQAFVTVTFLEGEWKGREVLFTCTPNHSIKRYQTNARRKIEQLSDCILGKGKFNGKHADFSQFYNVPFVANLKRNTKWNEKPYQYHISLPKVSDVKFNTLSNPKVKEKAHALDSKLTLASAKHDNEGLTLINRDTLAGIQILLHYVEALKNSKKHWIYYKILSGEHQGKIGKYYETTSPKTNARMKRFCDACIQKDDGRLVMKVIIGVNTFNGITYNNVDRYLKQS